MTTSVKTNVSQLIREVAEEIDSVDPREIAKEVALRVPEDEVRAFYAAALPHQVRAVLGTARNTALNTVPKTNTISSIAGEKTKKKPASIQSRIRDWWAEFCDVAVHVGSEYKKLGDCDYADLIVLHDERVTFAESVLTQADKYQNLAKLVETEGVSSVKDLDKAKVQDLLGI